MDPEQISAGWVDRYEHGLADHHDYLEEMGQQ